MTTSRDPNSVIYIGFWKRVLACIIDAIIITPICLIAMLPFFSKLDPDSIFSNIFVFVILMTLSWIYSAGLQSSSWQATVGKKVLGIIVVDEYGDRLTLKRATGRFFASILSSLCFNVGYIIVAFTKHKQGLHDKIAKTFVIKK